MSASPEKCRQMLFLQSFREIDKEEVYLYINKNILVTTLRTVSCSHHELQRMLGIRNCTLQRRYFIPKNLQQLLFVFHNTWNREIRAKLLKQETLVIQVKDLSACASPILRKQISTARVSPLSLTTTQTIKSAERKPIRSRGASDERL